MNVTSRIPAFFFVGKRPSRIMIWYIFNYSWVDTRRQYTFTHKQYTEQHNETEYLEWNIGNNKNT